MTRRLTCLAIAAWGAALPQTVAGPQFDVATIKVSLDGSNASSGIRTAHGRMDATNVTVSRCIMGAWSVGPNQILGAPQWLDSERFTISAKSDPPAADDLALMIMLQSLLAERFELVLHRETRNLPTLVLEVMKNGLKMELTGDGEASTSSSNSNTGAAIDARNTSMDLFAQVLGRGMGLPVINRTGLSGKFNFRLHWLPDRAPSSAQTDDVSLPTALQEQLGLQLRAQKGPVDVLVIDHVEHPSEN